LICAARMMFGQHRVIATTFVAVPQRRLRDQHGGDSCPKA